MQKSHANADLHTLYKIRFKPVQIVNLDGGTVENAVLAVFLGGNAAAAAQNVGQRQLVIRQNKLNRAHAVVEHLVNFIQQRIQAVAGLGALYLAGYWAAQQALLAQKWTAAALSVGLLPFKSILVLLLAAIAAGVLFWRAARA